MVPTRPCTAADVLLEARRWTLVAELRKSFDAACRAHFGAKPAAEAFNGWVFECLAQPGASAASRFGLPVVGRPDSPAVLTHMLLKVPQPWDYKSGVDGLRVYVSACAELAGRGDGGSRTIAAAVEALDVECRSVTDAGRVRALLAALLAEVPSLRAAVAAVAAAVNAAARAAAAELDNLAEALSPPAESAAAAGWVHVEVETMPGKRGGPPMVRFALRPADGPPPAAGWGQELALILDRQPLDHSIHAAHAARLETAHDAHGGGGSGREEFGLAAWRLLHRYEQLYGSGGTGGGWQLATPPAAMAAMQQALRISCECFASPLNRSALLGAVGGRCLPGPQISMPAWCLVGAGVLT